MRIIAAKKIEKSWAKHPETRNVLATWYNLTEATEWRNSAEVRSTFPRASIIDNSRVVFNILGGNFRLVTRINYQLQLVNVIWFGTHGEYDRLDVRKMQ